MEHLYNENIIITKFHSTETVTKNKISWINV